MAGGAGWAALAGFANAFGSDIEKQRDQEFKMKLYEQEQALMEKRETTLAQIRANLQDQNAANRSGRAMDRDAAKHAMTQGDVTGAFKDEETGNYYGRTKGGDVVPLNITSDDYQSMLKQLHKGKADEASALPALTEAKTAEANAATANLGNLVQHRDNPTPKDQGPEIRKSYQTLIRQQQTDDAKKAAAAAKAGTDYTPMDPLTMHQTAQASLYDTYGADAVNASLGGANNKPKQTPRAAPTAQNVPASDQVPMPPAGQAPGSTGAPSMQQLMDAANAAVKAGKDPNAVQARLLQLMQQYGYKPGQ